MLVICHAIFVPVRIRYNFNLHVFNENNNEVAKNDSYFISSKKISYFYSAQNLFDSFYQLPCYSVYRYITTEWSFRKKILRNPASSLKFLFFFHFSSHIFHFLGNLHFLQFIQQFSRFLSPSFIFQVFWFFWLLPYFYFPSFFCDFSILALSYIHLLFVFLNIFWYFSIHSIHLFFHLINTFQLSLLFHILLIFKVSFNSFLILSQKLFLSIFFLISQYKSNFSHFPLHFDNP